MSNGDVLSSNRAIVDSGGSSIDTIFADAVQASMPTLVVDEYNLMPIKEVPGQYDSITVPVLTNFDLTWNVVSGTDNETGSDITTTSVPATSWRKLTPVLYSAGIFIHDMVDLTVNKQNFDTYATLGGVSVQRYMDVQTIASAIFKAGAMVGSKIYAAGGLSAGSIDSGSTITVNDLSDAKKLLSVGSDIYNPDTAVMHPNQYTTLLQTTAFYTQNYAVSNKAKFSDGELVEYDGMKIVVTELVNQDVQAVIGDASGYWSVAGHPVAVFNSKVTGCMAKKTAGFKVTTIDQRIKHGKMKIFDIMFTADVLVAASAVIIRAAD